MERLGVLDLGHGSNPRSKLLTELYPFSSEISHPLDLSLSKSSNVCSRNLFAKFEGKGNGNLSCSFAQKSRWNHRSHTSIDSDSSFESEQESDHVVPGMHFNIQKEALGAIQSSLGKSASVSNSGIQNLTQADIVSDPEVLKTGSKVCMGFYKELPELTANVCLDQRGESSVVLELSSCQAEIIDAEVFQTELKSTDLGSHICKDGEEDDSSDSNCLQIIERESYLEEILQMKTGSVESIGKITGIQETAKKFIEEIHKTKSDLSTLGLNLEVNGKKQHKCFKCKDKFHSIAALLQHQVTHSSRNPGEKLIRCPLCMKRFTTLTTLEGHIEKLHTGDMKYSCPVCEMPFKYTTHLRKHLAQSRCGRGLKKTSQNGL